MIIDQLWSFYRKTWGYYYYFSKRLRMMEGFVFSGLGIVLLIVLSLSFLKKYENARLLPEGLLII